MQKKKQNNMNKMPTISRATPQPLTYSGHLYQHGWMKTEIDAMRSVVIFSRFFNCSIVIVNVIEMHRQPTATLIDISLGWFERLLFYVCFHFHAIRSNVRFICIGAFTFF